jgi:hypothetical protein
VVQTPIKAENPVQTSIKVGNLVDESFRKLQPITQTSIKAGNQCALLLKTLWEELLKEYENSPEASEQIALLCFRCFTVIEHMPLDSRGSRHLLWILQTQAFPSSNLTVLIAQDQVLQSKNIEIAIVHLLHSVLKDRFDVEESSQKAQQALIDVCTGILKAKPVSKGLTVICKEAFKAYESKNRDCIRKVIKKLMDYTKMPNMEYVKINI